MVTEVTLPPSLRSFVASNPLITQACRPRQTSRPTGAPVRSMARAASFTACLSVSAPTSRYGWSTSRCRTFTQPRTLAPWDRPVTAWRAELPGELLEAQWLPRRSIPPGLDHVDHHLQARADALDEVGLRHEVRPARDVDLVAVGGAGRRGNGNGTGEGDGGRQRRPGEQSSMPLRARLISGHC